MLAKSKTSLSLSRSFSIHQHSKKAIFVKSPTTIVLGHHSRGHYWRYEANKGGKCQKPILFFSISPPIIIPLLSAFLRPDKLLNAFRGQQSHTPWLQDLIR